MGERNFCQPFHLLSGCHVAAVKIPQGRQIKACFDIGFLYRRIRGELAIGQARRMAQQILHRHFAVGGSGRVGYFCKFRIRFSHAYLHSFERRQMFRHGIV